MMKPWRCQNKSLGKNIFGEDDEKKGDPQSLRWSSTKTRGNSGFFILLSIWRWRNGGI
ncbi:hypothetical protein AT5G50562 [Arabidopsis thaliana]|jgi:hypothetical protein|uniref:Uncharacterized protein n=1 Tax=Arabidopsis thaliana TaxID=3702 RepID=B3H5R2_ARATH|nr:uncharacterized protein AT5G50562 [Arabidopsis thaliana]AED95961.1 hypothetical protein AT5G50562 [Arabidopsis thaliana]|eukprot:NP_001119409.1 hypothetical protein AT5G50562 [Arabidopsis thaliana]